MLKNRYFKSGLGIDADILVAKAVAYSADADMKAFAADTTAGETIVTNPDTNILRVTTPMVAGNKFQIHVKQANGVDIFSSLPMEWQPGLITKIAYAAPVLQVSTITATVPAPIVANQNFGLVIVDNTAGTNPLPRWSYYVTTTATDTWTGLLDRLVAKINSNAGAENQGRLPRIVTAARVSNNLTLTAVAYGTHFGTVLRDYMYTTCTVAVTTTAKVGSGVPQEVLEAENFGIIKRGVGHYYPMQNATAAEFGIPTSMVNLSGTYVTYVFQYWNAVEKTALRKEERKNRCILYVEDSTVDPIAALDLIFGT
jgi:hypothetical protein